MKSEAEITVTVGEYTVIFERNGMLYAHRHGKPWRNLVGDGLMLALIQRIDQQQKLIDAATK